MWYHKNTAPKNTLVLSGSKCLVSLYLFNKHSDKKSHQRIHKIENGNGSKRQQSDHSPGRFRWLPHFWEKFC